MKTLRLLKYDINEGTLKYLFRYLFIVPFVLVSCIKFDADNVFTYYMSGERASAVEQMYNLFGGAFPFDYHADTSSVFSFPMNWIMVYVCLALLIGGHIKDSTKGFGLQLFVGSGNRIRWWIAKCIWAVFVTASYICFIFITIMSYEWIRYGNVSFDKSYYLFPNAFGTQMDELVTYGRLLAMAFIMPFLVGVIQSLIQMILSLYVDTGPALSVVLAAVVLSVYYSGSWGFYGYAMNVRYGVAEGNSVHVQLSFDVGRWYLLIAVIVFFIAGAVFIRRKDVLKNE